MEKVPIGVTVAFRDLAKNKKHRRHRHRQLADILGLSPKTKQSKLEGVRTTYLPCHKKPYPPPEKDIYETEEIAEIWRNHRYGKKHPDKRGKAHGKWPEMERLDEKKLALTVEAEDSVIVRDEKTHQIVAVVLRNFTGDEEVLEWVSSVADENVGIRRGIRVCGSRWSYHMVLTRCI